jgi:hypothetical protein
VLDELRLPAGPLRRDDQRPGGRVGDLGAVVAAQQMQARVQAGGAARAGDDRALVDVEHVADDRHPGEPGGEAVQVPPVRRGPPAVEQPRLGQHERAQAQPDHRRAVVVCAAHRAVTAMPAVVVSGPGRSPAVRTSKPATPNTRGATAISSIGASSPMTTPITVPLRLMA